MANEARRNTPTFFTLRASLDIAIGSMPVTPPREPRRAPHERAEAPSPAPAHKIPQTQDSTSSSATKSMQSNFLPIRRTPSDPTEARLSPETQKLQHEARARQRQQYVERVISNGREARDTNKAPNLADRRASLRDKATVDGQQHATPEKVVAYGTKMRPGMNSSAAGVIDASRRRQNHLKLPKRRPRNAADTLEFDERCSLQSPGTPITHLTHNLPEPEDWQLAPDDPFWQELVPATPAPPRVKVPATAVNDLQTHETLHEWLEKGLREAVSTSNDPRERSCTHVRLTPALTPNEPLPEMTDEALQIPIEEKSPDRVARPQPITPDTKHIVHDLSPDVGSLVLSPPSPLAATHSQHSVNEPTGSPTSAIPSDTSPQSTTKGSIEKFLEKLGSLSKKISWKRSESHEHPAIEHASDDDSGGSGWAEVEHRPISPSSDEAAIDD